MNKRGIIGKLILYVFLLILLGVASYFLYINILNLTSEPVQFIANTTQTNPTSYSSQQQFYPNMRFAGKTVSYTIEPECTEEKRARMLEAFSKLEEETELKFSQDTEGQILVSCQEQEEEIPGELFIAGEGGPTETINTSLFYVIEKGKILLSYKNSRCDNYNVELHELLHVLGFEHSESEESIMHNTTLCNQILTYDIVDELERLYSIPQLADLYFSNVSAVKHGIYLDFYLEIRNQGLADSGNIQLELYSEEKFDEFNITSINYGEGRILEVKNTRLPSRKTNQIKFVIVSGEELDKKNNVAELFLPPSS